MSEIRESECRTCQCVIFWTVTEAKGTRMPVDWDGTNEGDFYIVHNDASPPIGGDARAPVAIHRRKYEADPTRWRLMRRGRRLSHFATCPDRDQHRRKR